MSFIKNSFLLLAVCNISASAYTLHLEAEDGAYTGSFRYRSRASGTYSMEFEGENCTQFIGADKKSDRIRHRSDASNQKTILLKSRDEIQHVFKVNSSCDATVGGIYYSNDGKTDIVFAYIDHQNAGHFETSEEYGNGHLWNHIRHSGSMENKISINAGTHTLRISITTEDFYGVEIDKTSLEFFCPSDDEGYDEHDNTTVYVIISCVCGVVLTIVAVLTLLLSVWYKKKKHSKRSKSKSKAVDYS